MRVDTILAAYHLYEANVFNIKDEYEGVSINKYLKTHAQNLPGAELQNLFIKKLTNLLVNDERFLYAVRQLPTNAPEWAQKAVAAQQLYAFRPTDKLNDMVTHTVHYLAAAADDVKNSPSPDQRVVAQRELAAFPKAENLDVIEKKSQEFFKRGSRKAGREVAGMEKVFDAGQGYVWYKLTDEEAFRREGQALQNCIGRIYTKASTEKAQTAILILKNPSNESVVAMNVSTPNKEVIEMKGKNNRPPIDKYMVAVASIINHMKLSLGYTAKNDTRNAGYYYDETNKEILTRPEAIKRFTKTKHISDVHGKSVVETNVENTQLLDDLYGFILPSFARHAYGGRDQVVKLYDLRTSANTPLVTAVVVNGKLQAVGPHRQQAQVQEAEQSPTNNSIELIGELLKHNLVKEIDPTVQRQVLWQNRLTWNPEKAQFEPLTADEKIETGKEHIKWNEFKNKNVIKQLYNSLLGSYNDQIGDYAEGDIKQVVMASEPTKGIVSSREQEEAEVIYFGLVTNDNVLIPVRAISRGPRSEVATQNFGFKGVESWRREERDSNVIDSLAALANRNGLQLPKSVRLHHGLVRDEKGKYKQYEPDFKKVSGTVSAEKLDLANLSPGDRLAALSYVSSNPKLVGDDPRLQSADLLGIQTATARQSKKSKIDDVSKWEKGQLSELYKKLFRGESPETMYVVDVNYGTDYKDKILLLVDKDKVVRVDTKTMNHRFQKWSDFDTVAKQLNQFAEEHKLKFDPQALTPLEKAMQETQPKRSRREHGNEMRIDDGKITTAANIKQKEIEHLRQKGKYAKEGTDELKFADGAKMVRMDPSEQAEWVRRSMHGEGGRAEAWKIYDANGEYAGIVTVAGNGVQSMYGRTSSTSAVPASRGVVFKLMPYVEQAANVFGWRKDKGRAFQIKPGGKVHSELRKYSNYRTRHRGYLRDADRFLLGIGAIRTDATRVRYRILSITEKGTRMLQRLNSNQPATVFDYVSAAELPKDFVKPQPKEPPKKASRVGTGKWKVSTAAPRAGSAADRALSRFRDMTTDLGRIPTRSEFIRELTSPPFNMSKMGAQTYYYTTKAKYAALGETFSAQAAQELKEDLLLHSFKAFIHQALF